MKTLKYLFYDNANNINTKELKINSFKYNNKTKIKEFYLQLKTRFYSVDDCEMEYVIVDNIYNNKITFDNFDKDLEDLLKYCNLKNVVLIYPILPIGGTGAIYKGYRIYIHSDELRHKYLPHVHVEYGGFIETRINLNTLEIMDDDIFNSRKDKKKVLGYLKDNQEKWIGYYNSIVVDGIDPGIKIEKII